MLLRDEFINAVKWDYSNCEPYSVFTTFSSIVSYKGLHVLIDAITILKKEFPSVKLNVAGVRADKAYWDMDIITGLKRK